MSRHRRLSRAPWWAAQRSTSGVLPTWAAQFASGEGGHYMADGVSKSFAGAITFTRDSDGTFFDAAGILQTASTDVARFDHTPATGVRLGLLGEEEQVNQFTKSKELDHDDWTKSRIFDIAENTGTAPDGTTTSDKIIANTVNNNHLLQQAGTFVSGTVYTMDGFFEAGGINYITLIFTSTSFPSAERKATFNLANGTVSAAETNVNTKIEHVGGGIYYCAIYRASDNSGTAACSYALSDDGTNLPSFIGNDSDGVFGWGLGIKDGIPTSFVATDASAVTRKKDSITVVEGRSGTELVTNGTFDTDLSGWDIVDTGTTVEWQSPGVVHFVTAGAQAQIARSVSGLTIGRTYRTTCDVDITSGSAILEFNVAGDTSSGTGPQTLTVDFIATATGHSVLVKRGGAGEFTADNVTTQEVLPHPGYGQAQNTIAGKLTLTDVTTSQVLCGYTDGTSDNFIEMFVSSGNLQFRVRVAQVLQGSITLGAVSSGVPFTFAFSYIQDALRGSLNGGTEVNDTTPTILIPAVLKGSILSRLGSSNFVGQGRFEYLYQYPTAFSGAELLALAT